MKFKAALSYIVLLVLLCVSAADDDEDPMPVKLIKDENYPVEEHSVVTEDEYILTIHRIPGSSSNSTPVYLQHGLLSSSTDWILSGKNESLAYFLHDNGYDVWIGNVRGNTFSRKHKSLSTTDTKFWDFSFHEQGFYDVPASVQYISNLTNSSIYYVGHSMGCSTFSIMAITRPEVAKNVRAMVALAPAAYEFNIRQPLLKFLSRNWRVFRAFANKLEINQFMPRNFLIDFIANRICTIPLNIGGTICRKLVHLLEGSNPRNVLTPMIWKSFPAGTSVKVFTHWLQQMNSKEFRNFDYGLQLNLKTYGNSTPPHYDLSDIRVPMAIFYSDNDIITTSRDVQHFYQQLPMKLGLFKIGQRYGHADFIWGKNNTELINKQILKILESNK